MATLVPYRLRSPFTSIIGSTANIACEAVALGSYHGCCPSGVHRRLDRFATLNRLIVAFIERWMRWTGTVSRWP